MSAEPPDVLEGLLAQTLERMETGGLECLYEACRTHPSTAPELLRRVDALRSAGLLTLPDGGPFLAPGERIGQFRVIRSLGAGGMGVVYLAVQEDLGRLVALKLVRDGYPGSDMRSRFRREAESVARLQHPGIVQIHTFNTSHRVAHLAMEFIEGCTLADALSALKEVPLDVRTGTDLHRVVDSLSARDGVAGRPSEPLEQTDPPPLFRGTWKETSCRIARDVADALEHAHQAGVLHRDVKPSNVMLTARGRVILVDFGLARVFGPSLVQATAPTQLVGTLPYMSPEQVRGASVDARTDVHGVGVLLFELLAGRLPYDFGKRDFLEIITLLADGEPGRLGDLRPDCRGDLDAVVTRALEKDPRRRYPSAMLFSQDLDGLLRDQPVSARVPGAFERFRRMVRRHRVASLGLASTLLALMLGLVGTTLQSLEAAHSAREAKIATVAARRSAAGGEERLMQAEQVIAFLEDVFMQASPTLRKGPEPTLGQALELAAARIPKRADPRAEAAIRSVIGRVLLSLGQEEEAEEHLRSALRLNGSEPSPDAVSVLTALARLAHSKRTNGSEVLDLQRRALDMSRSLPSRHGHLVSDCLHNLGSALLSQGRAAEAAPLFEDAAAHYANAGTPRARAHAVALGNHARALAALGRLDDAERMFRDAAQKAEATLGRHPELAGVLDGLADVLQRQDQNEAAERVAYDALAIFDAHLPVGHPDRMRVLLRVARLLELRGAFVEAQGVLERLAHAARATNATGSPIFAAARCLAAKIKGSVGELEAAEADLRGLWEELSSKYGPGHPTTLMAMEGLEDVLLATSRVPEAVRVLAEHLRVLEDRGRSTTRASVLLRYGLAQSRVPDLDRATQALGRALAELEGLDSQIPARLREAVESLAEVLGKAGLDGEVGELRSRYPALGRPPAQ